MVRQRSSIVKELVKATVAAHITHVLKHPLSKDPFWKGLKATLPTGIESEREQQIKDERAALCARWDDNEWDRCQQWAKEYDIKLAGL